MNHTYRLVWSPTQQRYVPTAETARSRGKSASGKALLPAAVVLSTALLSSPGFAQAPPVLAPNALPTGGEVVAGQASIGQQGSQMTITQGSDKAILNWNSFNIGQDARVQFQQPGSGAVALNRVVAGDASQIHGQLAANGQVWLVNPNGVVFGAGSQVDVGGLVASTLDITNQDFLDGKAIFKRDGATGGIVNEGQITAVGDGERGGLIALLAPTVRNDGVLTAKLGNVALAAGDRITLNAGAGGLLQVEVEPATLRTLVENRQMIVADGGQVVMTGKAADALSGSVVANTGTVQARTIANQQGRIMLLGDAEHGSVQVGGLLDASSSSDPLASAQGGQQLNASGSSGQGADVPVSAPWGQGGSIEVTGKHVALAAATLDASGAAGGGDIKVGGGWQGGGTLARAKTTTVDATSRLKADATQKGDGGTVVVWSDDKTRYAGHISAKGGSTGGNGGKAEVSGKAVLEFAGTADLSAAKGRFGDLLLDPYNLTIVSGSGGTVVATGNDSTLGANTLTAALAGANVTVSTGGGGAQAGDITVNAPVAWSANTTLTLQAAGDIAINRNITATGASAGLELSHGAGKDYQVGERASVTLSGASASLKIGATGALNTYTLLRDVNDLQAIPANSTGNFALAGDIDAAPLSGGAGFAPIADFGGTFTGLGHVVNGLTINRPAQANIGLFGITSSGSTIRNVGMVGGSVSGSGYIGTLAGVNTGAIAHAYATGTVQGLDQAVGGLVGINTGTISGAYATGAVVGARVTGGLVGYNTGSINQAYATGSVTWTDTNSGQDFGGLVGYHGGWINQAYATGAVRGRDRVGGLVGITAAGSTIAESYATGAVTGTAMGDLGGLIGWKDSGTVATSFYATTDPDGSLINNGGTVGGAWAGNANGTGKTYTEMMNPATFTGWNTAIWNIARGNTAPGYEVGLPALTRVTPAASIARTTLFQGGMGNAGNPYGITDWQQLANINQVLTSGYTFNLGNALDGSSGGYALLASATANGGLGWKPLGSYTTSFKGSFDGQDHTISGLVINRPAENTIGLFGVMDAGGAIRNLGLLGVNITGSGGVGALVGASQPGSTISRVYASGAVSGSSNVGGLVGINVSDISQSYTSTTVAGSNASAGGLIGSNSGVITDSYATGTVAGRLSAGGLVGFNSGTIERAYSTGTVSGTGNLGGLAGFNDPTFGVVADSFYATTSADGSRINNGGVANATWRGNSAGTAKTHAELMAPATFTGWDPGIWDFGLRNAAAGYEVGLPALTGLTRAADMVRTTLFQGGMGTAGSPYGVTDWQQLANINQVLAGGYTFNLGNNLDSSSSGYALLASATANGGLGWKPLSDGSTFSGTFDGQDHTISGLVINRPLSDSIGLFGHIANGSVIRNIGLLNASVAGRQEVGALVGGSASGSAITRAYASGDVKGEQMVGGLVGFSQSIISKSYASSTVISNGQAGGLVGVNTGGTITDSYATGAVSSDTHAGGLVGTNEGTIGHAYATGSVSGNADVGGLVGFNDPVDGAVSDAFYATTNPGGNPINNGGVVDATWGGNNVGIAKTRAELMSPATFASWNTATWTFARGNTVPGYESGLLPLLTGVTRAADMVSSTLFQGGMGIAGNPYGITDWQQLANINLVLNGGYDFGLSNNLDSNSGGYGLLASATANGGQGWKPLGMLNTRFTGIFDGQNHTIGNLVINRPAEPDIGLFGFVHADGTLRNLGVVGANVTGIGVVGGLAGSNQGTIANAYVTGAVRSLNSVAGGLVGSNAGSITQAYATALVTGSIYVGGLVGNNQGVIDQSYATGTVTSNGNSAAGGLLGDNAGTVTRSFYATTEADGSPINNAGNIDNIWTGNGIGAGKTHAELTASATFGDWGADLATAGGSTAAWRIYDGHTTPMLRSFLQAATVTADLSGASKVYDGTIASGTPGYTHNAGSPLLGTLRYASNSANAGTYANTDGSLQLAGLYSGQQGYDITYAPASLVIAQAPLVPGVPGVPGDTPGNITGTLAGTVGKTYDGTTSATLAAGNFLLSGWVNKDGAVVTQTRGRYDSANAGSGKTVTVDLARSDYQATGTTNLGNYILPTQISGAVGTIGRAALTVTANDASKVYDGQAWRGGNGVRYSGFVNGETASVLGGALTYGGTSQGAVNAGTYRIAPGGLSADNYAIAFADGNLSVSQVALQAIAGTLTGTVRKTYDGTTVATLGSGNFLLSGWVSDDGATVTQTTGRYDSAGAGNGKTVTVDLARGDYQATGTTNLGNYILPTQVSAAVGTIDRAALTVVANDASKLVDGQAWQGGNGVGYRGFVNGENATVLAGSLAYGGSAQGAIDAGDYVLTARGLSSGNYAIDYQDGTLKVTSRPGNGNPGGNDPGNGQPPGVMASAPSGSSVWRAVNRDTPNFMLSPEDREPHPDNSVMHLSVAPDFIRVQED